MVPIAARMIPIARICISCSRRRFRPAFSYLCRRNQSVSVGKDEPVDQENEVSDLASRLNHAYDGFRSQFLAPSWLPFLPESSYWLPPCPQFSKMLEHSVNRGKPMTDEQLLSEIGRWSRKPKDISVEQLEDAVKEYLDVNLAMSEELEDEDEDEDDDDDDDVLVLASELEDEDDDSD